MDLTCPTGKFLKINAAEYGRRDKSICPGTVLTTDCCDYVTEVVQRDCEGKNSCTVPATNDEMDEDPCYGTYKYLEVFYICI